MNKISKTKPVGKYTNLSLRNLLNPKALLLGSLAVGVMLAASSFILAKTADPDPKQLTLIGHQAQRTLTVSVLGAGHRGGQLSFIGPLETDTCDVSMFGGIDIFELHASGSLALQPQAGSQVQVTPANSGKYYCFAFSFNNRIIKTSPIRIAYAIEQSLDRGRLLDGWYFWRYNHYECRRYWSLP